METGIQAKGKKKMSEPIETVKLKNGTEEARPMVAVTMFALNGLMEEGKVIVLYELVQLCRNRDHVPWGKTGEDLKALSLIENRDGWHVHDSIRNIVLSAAKGEGLEMSIGNPVADKGE